MRKVAKECEVPELPTLLKITACEGPWDPESPVLGACVNEQEKARIVLRAIVHDRLLQVAKRRKQQ